MKPARDQEREVRRASRDFQQEVSRGAQDARRTSTDQQREGKIDSPHDLIGVAIASACRVDAEERTDHESRAVSKRRDDKTTEIEGGNPLPASKKRCFYVSLGVALAVAFSVAFTCSIGGVCSGDGSGCKGSWDTIDAIQCAGNEEMEISGNCARCCSDIVVGDPCVDGGECIIDMGIACCDGRALTTEERYCSGEQWSPVVAIDYFVNYDSLNQCYRCECSLDAEPMPGEACFCEVGSCGCSKYTWCCDGPFETEMWDCWDGAWSVSAFLSCPDSSCAANCSSC